MILLPEEIKEIENKMRKREKTETWRKVFDKVISHFGDHIIAELISSRYIMQHTVTYTCAHLQISRRLYFKYREAALNAFIAGLIQEGVLKLYE